MKRYRKRREEGDTGGSSIPATVFDEARGYFDRSTPERGGMEYRTPFSLPLRPKQALLVNPTSKEESTKPSGYDMDTHIKRNPNDKISASLPRGNSTPVDFSNFYDKRFLDVDSTIFSDNEGDGEAYYVPPIRNNDPWDEIDMDPFFC